MGSAVTEKVYRKQLRPVIQTGAIAHGWPLHGYDQRQVEKSVVRQFVRQAADSGYPCHNARPVTRRFRWSGAFVMVGDTGIEPVTSSVSGKRSPAELIARDPSWRWRRESNPCARLCRPLPHHSATPPLGLMRLHPRADDGIRTRDPHLGKVMRYQLRYIRTPRPRSSAVAKHDDSPRQRSRTNPFRTRWRHLRRGSDDTNRQADLQRMRVELLLIAAERAIGDAHR